MKGFHVAALREDKKVTLGWCKAWENGWCQHTNESGHRWRKRYMRMTDQNGLQVGGIRWTLRDHNEHEWMLT